MSQLCDRNIRGAIESGTIGLTPYDPGLIQPASIDLRLGSTILVPPLPLESSEEWTRVEVPSWYPIYPGDFLLGCTMERVRIPPTMAARIEGKSTMGRRGLGIHVTAGFVDPGFEGDLTLELVNHSAIPIRLHPGMRIAQMTFHQLTGIPDRLYGEPGVGSHYQGQTGATPPLYANGS